MNAPDTKWTQTRSVLEELRDVADYATPLQIPLVMRQREFEITDNEIKVGGKLVDHDAKFILNSIDKQINPLIRSYSDAYVINATDRCNMTCKYCYHPVDNNSIDRSFDSIIEEAENCGFEHISLMGAEPTVREDFPELIRELTKRGFKASCSTNAIKLQNPNYVREIKEAGIFSVSMSSQFSGEFRPEKLRRIIFENLIESSIPIGQLSFTVETLDGVREIFKAMDCLIKWGVEPAQFVIRAGAGTGVCEMDCGLYMSDMVKTALGLGAERMLDGGTNLYYCSLVYKGLNLHVIRWPTADTAIYHSLTGPTFATPLGPMLSPMAQIVATMTPEEIEREKSIRYSGNDEWVVKYAVDRKFGTVWAGERVDLPGMLWVHNTFNKFGKTELKQCREIWPKFLAKLVELGYKEVYSCIPENELKNEHYHRMFGMTELKHDQGLIVFKKELTSWV